MSDSKSTEEPEKLFLHHLEIGLNPLFDKMGIKESKDKLFAAIVKANMLVLEENIAKRIEDVEQRELSRLESEAMLAGKRFSVQKYLRIRRREKEATLNNQTKTCDCIYGDGACPEHGE